MVKLKGLTHMNFKIKSSFKKLIFLILLLILSATLLFSLEISLKGGIDNTYMKPKSVEPVIDDGLAETFDIPLSLLILANVKISGKFGNKFNFFAEYDMDQVRVHTLSGGLGYALGHFDIGLGFFLDAPLLRLDALDPGLSGSIGMHWTKAFFFKATAGSSLDMLELLKGSSNRFFILGEIGFWIPHIYTVFRYYREDYQEMLDDKIEIAQLRSIYSMRTEFFSKNVPFRVAVMASYRALNRSITAGNNGSQKEDPKLGMFIFGLGLTFELSKYLSFGFDAELNVNFDNLDFGNFDFKDPNGFLSRYRVFGGFTFSYPERDY
ncbi:MAG: hypothetical protein Ta2G_16020 [Termitinemataceae bacterium]|nr:MAG: hypothetical protein Ta2G_16020 [Termitinemataceae bacterium]